MNISEFEAKMKQFANDLAKLDKTIQQINKDLREINQIVNPAPKADELFKAIADIFQDHNNKILNKNQHKL